LDGKHLYTKRPFVERLCGGDAAVLSSLVVAPALVAGTLHAATIEFEPRALFYRTKAADALVDMIGLQHG
jgi:hypothetical protein